MTRLSNRQYPMLRALVDNGSNHYMSIEEAQQFDQRPFRSMLIQGWCSYRPSRGFHVTALGKAALDEFLTTEIVRKNPNLPLTAYFDPTAYGLHIPTRKGATKQAAPKKVLTVRELVATRRGVA